MRLARVPTAHWANAACNTADHKSPSHPPKSSTFPFHTTRWLPLLHDAKDYRVLELGSFEIRMLKLMATAGNITNDVSPGSLVELYEAGIVSRIAEAISQLGGSVFVRWDECSPIDGMMKLGPMTTAREVLLQICTSARTLRAIETIEQKCAEEKTELKSPLILVRYDDTMDIAYEFRCFVYEDRLTAISQKAWHTYTYDWREAATTIWGMAEDMLRKIVNYHDNLDDKYSELLDLDEDEQGFTFDIRVKGAKLPERVEDVQLIKLNAFGDSGSAFSHWTKDWKLLIGESGQYAEMRIVVKPTLVCGCEECYEAYLRSITHRRTLRLIREVVQAPISTL